MVLRSRAGEFRVAGFRACGFDLQARLPGWRCRAKAFGVLISFWIAIGGLPWFPLLRHAISYVVGMVRFAGVPGSCNGCWPWFLFVSVTTATLTFIGHVSI